MGIRALNESEVDLELRKASLWRREAQEIVRVFQFAAFAEAMRFVNAIAEAAERADHHPDILIQHARVTLRLSTHDCGGLSARDFAFARQADELCCRC